MTDIDFDWTDAGSPEDHACKLEAISERAFNRGRYQESTELHVAAQCIRYLGAKVEVLEKENDAAEAEIDRLTKLASRLDAQLGKRPCQNKRCLPYADMRAENEALREAGREVLGALAPLTLGGMPLDSRMDAATSRLKTVLAAAPKQEGDQ